MINQWLIKVSNPSGIPFAKYFSCIIFSLNIFNVFAMMNIICFYDHFLPKKKRKKPLSSRSDSALWYNIRQFSLPTRMTCLIQFLILPSKLPLEMFSHNFPHKNEICNIPSIWRYGTQFSQFCKLKQIHSNWY